MNQAELRQLTEERIKDAEVLLNGNRWEFAYYSAGYAVECALKSCVLSQMVISGWVFKDDVKKVDECRTHDFTKLIEIAGLIKEFNQERKKSASTGSKFLTNWDLVSKWTVTSRYESKTEAEARSLLAAIVDDPDGILKWIRNYW